MELNLSGIDSLLNPTIPQQPKSETPDLNLDGVDKILSASNPVIPSPDKIVFQPENSDWSLGRLSSIEDFYLKEFSKPLPIRTIGQGNIHNKWNYDHRASADISLNPNSKEGKKLISYLQENNIPFLAFNKAISGVSTGPHIHIGRASHKIGKDFVENQELNLEGLDELNLTGLEEVLSPMANAKSSDRFDLDITGVGNIQAPLDLTFTPDPNKMDFKTSEKEVPALLNWITKYNKPQIIGNNPLQAGELIQTEFTYDKLPSIGEGIDHLLAAWKPEYADLNAQFQSETGGLNILNVTDSTGFIETLGNNKYRIKARPTRAAVALLEAYKNGGLREYNATLQLINNQKHDIMEANKVDLKKIKEYQTQHPYLSAFESAFEREVGTTTQLVQNVKYLSKAVATGNWHGYDSKEYIDLINKNREDQETLEQLESSIYNPPSTAGKIIAGATGGVIALPRFILAGRLGLPSLPVMTYLENLHRGNREAAIAALPMALMVGGMHGASKFLGASSGTIAPFVRVTQKDLSLFQEGLVGESKSIANLTPLERQLILRGGNALVLGGSTLLESRDLREGIVSLVVGLTFPVGKGPKEVIFGEYVPPPPKPKIPLQLEQTRINIPLTKFNKPILEQYRDISPVIYPSAESPDVIKYAPIREGKRDISNPSTYVAETEKGFVATGQGQTLHLDLDTANLNLLELKRSLEEKTYRVEGDDLKTILQKQQAIKNAIDVLESAIPEQTKKFFEENEKVIREALKTNYEARFGKENFLKQRQENLKPNDIKVVEPETPKVSNLKQSPKEIFGGKAGDYNEGVSQEAAAKILKDFFKLTTQGTLKSSIIPYGDVLAKKAQDLGYLSAFYIEDFYRRGIVPTVDIVLNKVRESIGDFGKYISDNQAKKMFQDGMDYYNSNVADPFFSKMKLDATEKLPNRFTVEQARNILNIHSNESEWTIGLQDFLTKNEGKKISKQELIDFIQQNQVRVEESVTTDEPQALTPKEELRVKELERKLGYTLTVEEAQELLNLRQKKSGWQGVNKYSLRAYGGNEKLELPGAKNSKEVKLITPLSPKLPEGMRYEIFDPKDGKVIDYARDRTEAQQKTEGTPYDYSDQQMSRYESPHWDEGNVVAHYRSNDRITTDNQRVYFGEEFQSDWNHDIRTLGLKIPKEKLLQEQAELRAEQDKIVNNPNYEERDLVRNEQINNRLGELFNLINKNPRAVEPNPFMQHNWKELVLKRFLRDAAIAKRDYRVVPDKVTAGKREGKTIYSVYEGDNLVRNINNFDSFFNSLEEAQQFIKTLPQYKYDGVGWTTARQQLERYGGILEGKEFKWRKNSDGTYSFDFGRPHEGLAVDGIDWQSPHELQNISLERFAELTTKEAADFVREQENKFTLVTKGNKDVWVDNNFNPKIFDNIKAAETFLNDPKNLHFSNFEVGTSPRKGQFSLSETVELRSREGTYADYDVAYKNILSKIGKRFGAKYGEKEINTGEGIAKGWLSGEDLIRRGIITKEQWDNLSIPEIDALFEKYRVETESKTEKIHYLEITPSMRSSLEKEGLPLYGLGGSEPLKNPEVGIRNVLTTREAFNGHRDQLVKALEEAIPKVELNKEERVKYEKAILEANKEDLDNMQLLIEQKKGTIFNSGLSPDAFVDQAKLLYRGIQDFAEFTKILVERFGEQVKPFLQDLWMQVKDIAKAFNEDERGFLNLQFRRMKTEAEKKYRESKKSTAYYDWYSIHRGIMNAQLNERSAGIVYDVMRTGQRDKNAFEYKVLTDLRSANKAAKKHIEQDVAESIFIGNETQRLFTDAELAAGDPATQRPALNPDQIQAYRDAYKAEHLNLDKRLQHVLFGYRDRADRLNNRLNQTQQGTPQYTNIANQLLDIADAMKKVTDHYQHLKDTGYISLKRRGPIAAFVQDPAFPKGDKRGEVYRQFNSVKEAGKWVAEQEKLLNANPADSSIYDVNNPQRLRAAAARMTPAQFEDLIDSSGVNSRSPEIEKLRDEIYSRFPSKGYELKRDYVRGYDRSWQFVLESIADQTEAYANSFYSRVAGEHAIKALEATGLQADNVDLYKVMQKYIDHEISSPERSTSSQFFTGVRKGVYLFQLGFDVNQLYLNAIAQPITQTYSYFARVSHEGKMLGPFEAEKYWIEAWNLARNVAQKSVTGKGNVPVEFEAIRQQLIEEGVITPEFNKSLLESEAEKSVSTRLKPRSIRRDIEHWAGIFMRAGEKTTRTHVAAEAYLVGKEKFNLSGQDLVNFMVRSIDATQTNPSRAEAPLIIRGTQNQGEIRKLLYQFNAFNHMWLENLALNVKSDFQNRRISATSRHLIPLAIMGGITGLPLAGIAGALYTLITDKDPKEEFHKYVNNFPLLERLALYGVTGNATLSSKITPTVPFSEGIKVEDTFSDTLTETFSVSAIPAFATAGQIAKGFDDLTKGDKLRAAGSLIPLKPFRNFATAIRFSNEGIRTRKGKVIKPKNKVTNSEIFFQGLGIAPNVQTEYYNEIGRKIRTKRAKKLRKILF